MLDTISCDDLGINPAAVGLGGKSTWKKFQEWKDGFLMLNPNFRKEVPCPQKRKEIYSEELRKKGIRA